MSITYGEFVEKVLRLLDDPGQQIYEDGLVWDGICGAHEAIMPYAPKFAQATLTAGSAGDLYTLPTDLYSIQAVQDVDSGKFIPRATLAPLTARSSTSISDNDWIEYPNGYLNLSVALSEGDQLRLYYFAYWNKPETESDLGFILEVPTAALVGMMYYAGSHCLLPKSSNSANIRQFNLRVDSGNPEDNPLRVQAELYRKLFFQEMKMLPPYVKVSQ